MRRTDRKDIKTKRSSLVYTRHVLRNKPTRRADQDVREFPTYRVPEAAQLLGIPSRTIREWFSGRTAVLKPSGEVFGLPLLSFNDTAEAYALFLLRTQHNFPMQRIKEALAQLRKYTRLKRPLISDNLKVFQSCLVLESPSLRDRPRRVINLNKRGQMAIPDVMDVWAHRVLMNRGKVVAIFPWRNWLQDQESKPVEVDPTICSGRLVVTGTRIPVTFIAGRHKAGESIVEIANEYQLPHDTIAKALRHIDPKAA